MPSAPESGAVCQGSRRQRNGKAVRVSTSGGNLREAQKRLTMEKLVEAARELFHQNGYKNVTIDDIVESAGASRGTFYLYFRGKGEILGKIFSDEHIDAVVDLIEHFPAEPTREALSEWIRSYLYLYWRSRLTVRAWLQAGNRDAELRDSSLVMMDRVIDGLAAKVMGIRNARGLRSNAQEVKIRAMMMFVQMQEIGYYRYIRDYPMDEELAITVVADAWCYILAAASVKR